MDKKLGIIADDLTGAMDSSGYFAALKYSTVVALEPGYLPDAEVAVISTGSRADAPGRAAAKVRAAVGSLRGRSIYKKIDSTLKGNIGAELQAALGELACPKAIVAPAFPAMGRTTVGGVLHLAERVGSGSRVSPGIASGPDIVKLLAQSTGLAVGAVGVGDIEAGDEGLYHKISRMPEDVVVCDATRQTHLGGIARAAALAGDGWLLAGSAGLARELHVLLPGPPAPEPPLIPRGCPVLVIIGSRNEVSAAQLMKANDRLGMPLVKLDVISLQGEDRADRMAGNLAVEVARRLGEGNAVAVTTAFSRFVPGLERSAAAVLADAAARILAAREVPALVLSGGDTAAAVCDRLSVRGVRMLGEVEPGIPVGRLVGGRGDGIIVVTKAGGFGSEDTLVKSLRYLERGFD